MSQGKTQPASRLIDQRIRDLGGWRGETLARVRALILICTGESYQKAVKLTFARGAKVPDPSHLFNASLEGGTRRAIDIRKGAALDAAKFKALIRAAVAVNGQAAKKL